MKNVNSIKNECLVSYELRLQLLQFAQVFKFNIIGDHKCLSFIMRIVEESKGNEVDMEEAFNREQPKKVLDGDVLDRKRNRNSRVSDFSAFIQKYEILKIDRDTKLEMLAHLLEFNSMSDLMNVIADTIFQSLFSSNWKHETQ